MRLKTAVNWGLLCLNAILLLFLLFTLAVANGWVRLGTAVRTSQSAAAILGKNIYCAKSPFAIFVAKDFPRDGAFALVQEGAPLNLFPEDLNDTHTGATKRASLGLGATFWISFDYHPAKTGSHVYELMLSQKKHGFIEALTDLNADGVFDIRQTRDEEQHASRTYVWYQGSWREVMGADKDPKQDRYNKHLVKGDRVSFDMQSGQWLSLSQSSVPVQRPFTTDEKESGFPQNSGVNGVE